MKWQGGVRLWDFLRNKEFWFQPAEEYSNKGDFLPIKMNMYSSLQKLSQDSYTLHKPLN